MLELRDMNGCIVDVSDLKIYMDNNYEYCFFVGTDSQHYSKMKKVVYVTCIVLYRNKKGGKIFLSEDIVFRTQRLHERLMTEVMNSLQIANYLVDSFPNIETIVHIDVNSKKKFKSSSYYQELVGMITGQGFKCCIKPNAWAAQTVADKFSKQRSWYE